MKKKNILLAGVVTVVLGATAISGVHRFNKSLEESIERDREINNELHETNERLNTALDSMLTNYYEEYVSDEYLEEVEYNSMENCF